MRKLIHNRAFRSFLSSFLLMFVLPTIIMFYFMSNTLGAIDSEEHLANQLMLEQFKNGVDGQMLTIKRIGDTLIVDDKAMLFSTAKASENYLRSASIFQAIRALMQQVSTINTVNDNVEVSYLYFANSQKIISSTTMDVPVFYERRLDSGFSSLEEWLAFLNSGNNGFIRIANEEYAGVYYSRSYMRIGRPVITAVITLSDRFFSDHQAFQHQEGIGMTILGPDNHLLYSTLTDAEGLDQLLGGTEKSQDELYIHKSKSEDTGCTYIMTIPASVYTARLQSFQKTYFALAVVIILAGFSLAFLFAHKRYAPIRQLRDLVGERQREGENEKAEDDFAYLNTMVAAMKDETFDFNKRLKYSAQRMSHFEIERLLNGNYPSPAAIEEQLLSLDIVFPSDHFSLLAIRLNKLDSAELSEDKPLAEFVISNVTEELFMAYSPQIVNLDGLVVAILCLKQDETAEKISTLVAECAQVLRNHFSMHLTLCLSRSIHGLNELRYAYSDVRGEISAADESQETILYPWDEKRRPAAEEQIEIALHKLGRLISVGATDEVSAQLAHLRQVCDGIPSWSVRMMLTTLFKEISNNMKPHLSEEDFLSLSAAIRRYVESAVSPKEFDAAQPIVFMLTSAAPMAFGKAKNDEIAKTATAYITAHYADSNMSVQTVAQYLGLTAGYASTLYKKQTGHVMLDDINRLRLKKAKEMLTESKKSIEDIAQAMGFLNASTFIRTFKKYEGITPGQYRQSGR